MRGPALIILPILLAVTVLSGCRNDATAPLPPVGEARTEALRAACLRDGGALLPTSNGNLACLHQTKDDGKVCRRETDCEGACLARSGTCAPVTPLFGCNDVLTADGTRQTLCLN
ncbi:MAG: hypothetical protein Q7J57_04255 [Gemmobacter sp.]|nr:hypothetical protein [Gemmobacter sp.]